MFYTGEAFHFCLWFIEPTCAHLSPPVSVCLTRKKVTRKKFISQKLLIIGSLNFVRTWTWMTPMLTSKVRVIGQRSRSPGQKNMISGPIRPPYRQSLRSRVTWVKVKGHMGQGQRSILKVKVKGQGHQVKMWFRSHLTVLQVMFKVKGHGSGSKVTWVKVK